MYTELKRLLQRPEVFSVYTADMLWTRPHLANQMLQTHLDQGTSLASRPLIAIDRVVNWLNEAYDLNGKAICDLGCGPGLYTERYAQHGALVHGLDFSKNSIDYAKKRASMSNLKICYAVANYITDPLPQNQDLFTMIYCDVCPLSPDQRQILFSKIRKNLHSGGTFVFDVASIKAFENKVQSTKFDHNYMEKFWSGNEYFAFHKVYRYEDEKVSLDHFTIIEEKEIWSIYNWMQYYTPQTIESELNKNGFELIDIVGGFDVDQTDGTTFGVIAKPLN